MTVTTNEAKETAEAPEAPDTNEAIDALLRATAARIVERSAAAARASAEADEERKRPLLTAAEALQLAESPARSTLAVIQLGGLARSLLMPGAGFRCGIINAKSGRCPEDCAFCAQSKCHRTDAPVYDLVDTGTLDQAAKRLAAAGAARFGIVTSGRGPSRKDIASLTEALSRLKNETPALPIHFCASLGILTPDRARSLADAGFTRYHHNLETGRAFFPKI